MVTHVLVPVDDSPPATDALDFAIENYPDADLTALHVIDPSDLYAATGMEGATVGNYEQLAKHFEGNAERLLEEARDYATERGVEIETAQLTGGVSRSIVDYVEEHDVDHVVVGSHGRTGASRILLGSVAETVARRSPVPVTIVR